MANQEHLDILKQGVEVWNRWREENPSVWPDLLGADLRFAQLNGADLTRADLIKADLSFACLARAWLCDANLRYAKIWAADLTGAYLSYANLSEVSLASANLSRAGLSHAYLRHTNLWRADLTSANLSYAYLMGTDFEEANLSCANLSFARLSAPRFQRTNLTNVSLISAHIAFTVFGNVDLRTVKGLETVKHQGPSTIGIDTLYCSGGNIPATFLKGAGIDDTFIAYSRSLVGKPIEFYSCFISYSSKDQAFAERLYADLQSKNVRCWCASEDLKIGDKFWHRIDESIRLYDKLLVILSENSVASVWVENEVMAALEKEHQQPSKAVLFPIKLDNAVMKTNLPWAANMRRTRHIGDFTRWKEYDEYQKGLSRLLHDLKQEAIESDAHKD